MQNCIFFFIYVVIQAKKGRDTNTETPIFSHKAKKKLFVHDKRYEAQTDNDPHTQSHPRKQ